MTKVWDCLLSKMVLSIKQSSIHIFIGIYPSYLYLELLDPVSMLFLLRNHIFILTSSNIDI